MQSQFPNLESCNPSACISSKIMKCSRIVSRVFRKHLKPFDITNSQLTALFYITKAENVSQKQISETLYMDKSTVNRNLKRLMDRGYIVKLSIHEIQTTKKGKALLEQVIPYWENAMSELRTLLKDEGEMAVNMVLQKLI